jgi:Domain of unknown function (DUF3846)
VSQTAFSQRVAAPPIRVLIIYPDDTYELRTVKQDLKVLQGLVGGWVDEHPTPSCVFLRNIDSRYEGCPINVLATYFWWDRDPAGDYAEFGREGDDEEMLRGPIIVIGCDDEHGNSLPVPDEVIEHFERMQAIYEEHKDDDY